MSQEGKAETDIYAEYKKNWQETRITSSYYESLRTKEPEMFDYRHWHSFTDKQYVMIELRLPRHDTLLPFIRFTTNNWETYDDLTTCSPISISRDGYTRHNIVMPIFKKCVLEYAVCFTPYGLIDEEKQKQVGQLYYEVWDSNNKKNYKLECDNIYREQPTTTIKIVPRGTRNIKEVSWNRYCYAV
jgi:hypothetical protein